MNGDCYIFDEESYGVVSVGQEYCKNVGYNLAKISNEQENNYAMSIIQKRTTNNAIHPSFIGVSNLN